MAIPFTPPLSVSELEAAFPGIQVLQILGVGGQGAVFEAVSTGDVKCAIKVYGPDTVDARVEREIDKLQRLDSDYVVRLHNHGQTVLRGQNCRFAFMELVDGEVASLLVGRLDDGRVNEETRRLLIDIGHGISDVWSLRVVHRDIKPANIMRRRDGGYVILDLGLAKHLDDTTLTQLGLTCGTLGYMSPEQAAGRRGLTLRSDFFGLGIVAYELATGMHPYMRRQDLVGRIPVHSVCEIRPAISPEVSRIIARLLQPDPLARPRQLEEILVAIT